ncbi:M48 family metallopeptidase [Yinghuangia sp. KLBMP8922]|uniref:M48 family metallopeptidase n=1 Tax=Yinghuangia soli TaxID=2908204 RepID=A0AA41Q6R7_9ACTN|nr:M48 family metallopeptidase [Yinghuangia soli]MCF2531237.1 M48 family metallopeptidase [Yinghuangia soli]
MSGQKVLVLCLAVTAVVLLAAVAFTTPWRPLPDVPGGATAPDAARDFSAAEIARGRALAEQARPPVYLAMALSLAVTLLLGLTPLGARLVTAVARPFGGGWVWQVLLGGLALLVVGRLVALPFDARLEVVRRRHGLSVQTWPGWWLDLAKGFAMSSGLLLAVLVAFFALLRHWPRAAWPIAAGAGALLVVAISFLYPLLVEPAFNKFHPMPDGPLRTSLMQLAEKDGVPVEDVLVADASRRTTALNAYVSGFGSTRRIVVYDTTVQTATAREIELITAHELGHAKRNDVLHGTLIGAAGLAAGVCAAGLLVTWQPLLRRAGADSAADPRALALLMAVVAVVATLSGPAQMLISRRLETRADVHALDLTRDPEGMIAMQRRLALANRSNLTPNPVLHVLFGSHPATVDRIALARDWARLHGEPVPASPRP